MDTPGRHVTILAFLKGEVRMKTMWEYLTVELHAPNKAAFLNEQGEQGWELILVDGPTFYFKRPKAAESSRAT
jgi:hypothetical protein